MTKQKIFSDNDFFDLEVGESVTVNSNKIILRVPNGWVLSYWSGTSNSITSSVFIPRFT